MPRRKATPKPKRRAAARPLSAADAEKLEAVLRAAAAAVAPQMAQVQASVRKITAQQSRVIADLAATLRARAEAPATYALVLPTPSYALLARNATHAALKAPDAHTYAVRPYAAQTSLQDEPEAENYTRLLQGVSAPAQVLLAILAGRWADATHSPSCTLERNKHADDGTCLHSSRAVPFTLRALAQDLYGSKGGRQVAQVSALLAELEASRIEYGTTQTGADGVRRSAGSVPEPLLRVGMAGMGVSAEESRDPAAQQRTAVLARELHREYLTGSHRLVRPALLVKWRTQWQQELAIRLLGHSSTWYGSRAIRNSRDGLSTSLGIGRVEVGELGSLAELLPSLADDPRALRRRLQVFADELNSRSAPDELQVFAINAERTGRRITGWQIGVGYKVAPLKGAEARRLLREGGGRTPAERQQVAAYKRRRSRVQASELARTTMGEIVREIAPDTYEIPREIPERKNTTGESHEEPTPRGKWAEGDHLARIRREWATYDHSTREWLQAKYPDLADLPS